MLLTDAPTVWRDDALAEHIAEAGGLSPTFCQVLSTAYACTQYSTGEEELYDLQADPPELENDAANPAFATVLANERDRLHQPPPPGFTYRP